MTSAPAGGGPKLIHVTTTDMSLELLLGPQLRAFAAAGYWHFVDVVWLFLFVVVYWL